MVAHPKSKLAKTPRIEKQRQLQLAVDAVRTERRDGRVDGAIDRVLESPGTHRHW